MITFDQIVKDSQPKPTSIDRSEHRNGNTLQWEATYTY